MNEEEDPFRYCVYCKADCYADEPEHSAICPSSTGVFPVRETDLGSKCPGCGYQHGMVCSECSVEFKVSDHYTHRGLDDIGGIPCYEPICLGCAAQEAMTR